MTEDVRFALRALRRNPGFASIVVLTLGLGIGVNTAIYSVIYGALVQSLPYEGGGEGLVQLRQPAASEGTDDIGFSVQEILEYRSRTTALADVAEYHGLFFNVVGLGDPIRIQAGVVSANFFGTLGVEPLHGRVFTADDEDHSAEPVMVLTHDFWMNRLAGDAAVVGRTLEMNDRVHTVIGVLPPVPLYPSGADLYIPTSACPFRTSEAWTENRSVRPMSVFGRLERSSDLARLTAELQTVATTMHAEHPEAYEPTRGVETTAEPLREVMVEDARTTFLILFATAGLVLLIATVNVANLTFARLARRERELAVRTALGARAGTIVRLVITEAVLLGIAGATVGLGLASMSIGLLTDFAGGFTARATEIDISGPVLAFTLATALAAGALSGAIPLAFGALRSRSGLRVARGSETSDGRSRRLQGTMVTAQVAASFVLLMAAGLTIRSLGNLYAIDPGYSTSEVLTMEIPAPFTRPAVESQRFYQDLLDRVRTLPSVEAASVAMTFPLDGYGQMATSIMVEGREIGPGDLPPQADIRTVTSGYFETMGISILEGRSFTDEDQLDSAPIAVVNQSLAHRLFPDEEALGRRLSWNGGGTWLTIVGIAGDVRHYGMGDDVEMEVYQPAMLMMNSLLVRSATDASGLLRPIRDIVRELDPEQPLANVATMSDRRTGSLAPARLITSLLGFFAALAGVITIVGIAGVISFDVSQRTKELGIRLALGSSREAVIALLMRQGLLFTALGLGLGVAATLGLGRYIESLLFGVEATDAGTLVAVSIAFVAVAVLAVLLPARRASNIQPREVLTSE